MKNNPLLWSFLITGLVLFSSHTVVPRNGEDFPKLLSSSTGQVKTVVIDAGHGGKDPGCHGSYANEKDICLSIALKLGNFIKEHFSDVKVVYTRETDVFIELYNRAKIANDNHADLFICIHVNAAGSTEAYGAETYVLGLHKTEANLEVAKRENDAILMEDGYEAQYAGFDPNSPEGSILFSLYQNIHLNQSLSFASKVQEELTELGRHDRGVRQAGFLVLVKTTMPAVLIETGFLTNPDEETFLAGEDGKKSMASSIFTAFIRYKKEVEGSAYAGMKKDFGDISKSWGVGETVTTDTTTVTTENTAGIVFKVQFLSSKTSLEKTNSAFTGLKNVEEEKYSDWYRYTAGKETSYTKAETYLETVKGLGYKDAFIVAYQNTERLTVQEALQILEEKD